MENWNLAQWIARIQNRIPLERIPISSDRIWVLAIHFARFTWFSQSPWYTLSGCWISPCIQVIVIVLPCTPPCRPPIDHAQHFLRIAAVNPWTTGWTPMPLRGYQSLQQYRYLPGSSMCSVLLAAAYRQHSALAVGSLFHDFIVMPAIHSSWSAAGTECIYWRWHWWIWLNHTMANDLILQLRYFDDAGLWWLGVQSITAARRMMGITTISPCAHSHKRTPRAIL